MRTYIHLIPKGVLFLLFSLFTIGIFAQSPTNRISTSAIEAGFDADIFARKFVYKPKISSVNTTASDFFEDKVTDYNELSPKGKVKTSSMILQETKVETYNENRYPAPVGEGYTGYKIEILRTMEPVQENNPIFYKHGCISETQLSDESYSYLIGSFHSPEEAEDFNEKFIKSDYPEASIIQYKQGKRE